MADYWGLPAIARRMGVSKTTIVTWQEQRGFLMYLRRRGPRRYWFTNDQLIQSWEVAMCKVDRTATLHRRQALAAKRAGP